MEILSDVTFKGSIKIYDSGGGSPYYGHVLSTGNCTLYLKGNGSEGDIHFQIGPDDNRILITPGDLDNDPSIKLDSGSLSGGLSVGGGSMSLYLGSVGDGQSEVIISDSYDEHGNRVRFARGLTASSGSVVICSGDLVLKGSSISNWTDLNNILSFAKLSDIPSLSGYLTTSAASSTYLSKNDASTTYQKKFTTFSSPSIPANCTAFEFTGTAISDSNKTHLIQVQNTSTGKSVIAETWMTTNKKPAMSFAGCTSTVAAGTYTAIVL